MLWRELGVPKPLSASGMELGELMEEVVCPEPCCGAALTALQPPVPLPLLEIGHQGRLVTRVGGGSSLL